MKHAARRLRVNKGAKMKTSIAVLLALASLAASAQSTGLQSFLVSQWFEKGNQMCKYDNGTVLNVGAKTCPLSIRG